MSDTIEWSGVTVAYTWVRSHRKTLGITVRPDKSVSVRVPLRTPVREIREFVTFRADWVVKVWKKLHKRQPAQLQEYGRGAIFMYQGETFSLEFTTGMRRSLFLHDGLLMLATPELLPEKTVRNMIDNWYRKQSAELVMKRSIVCHTMMQSEGIPLPPIRIRRMKTRWGSYSYRTGRITLNLNLIKAPQACLDYVIIHELCHIMVPHHGTEFWLMVSRYIPDYLILRRKLQQYI